MGSILAFFGALLVANPLPSTLFETSGMTPMGGEGQSTILALFRTRILGQYLAATCSPGLFVLLLKQAWGKYGHRSIPNVGSSLVNL